MNKSIPFEDFLRIQKEEMEKLPQSIKLIEEKIKEKITSLEPYEIQDGRRIISINKGTIEILDSGIHYFPHISDTGLVEELCHYKEDYVLDNLIGPIRWINNAANYLKENPEIDLLKKVK
jgi:hypothetical protein